MKKSFFILSIIAITLASCNFSKNSENTETDSTKVDSTLSGMVGNDLDAHGCKPSAGQSWSVLKNSCVQIFNEGSQFIASGTNTDSTRAAYVIVNQKLDSAELFLPNFEPIIALKGKNALFESTADSISISESGNQITISKGKNVIFSQQKADGLGKLLGLK